MQLHKLLCNQFGRMFADHDRDDDGGDDDKFVFMHQCRYVGMYLYVKRCAQSM